MGLALIVHGGAGDIPPERHAAAAGGCRAAAEIGWRVLRAGGCALDAGARQPLSRWRITLASTRVRAPCSPRMAARSSMLA